MHGGFEQPRDTTWQDSEPPGTARFLDRRDPELLPLGDPDPAFTPLQKALIHSVYEHTRDGCLSLYVDARRKGTPLHTSVSDGIAEVRPLKGQRVIAGETYQEPGPLLLSFNPAKQGVLFEQWLATLQKAGIAFAVPVAETQGLLTR